VAEFQVRDLEIRLGAPFRQGRADKEFSKGVAEQPEGDDHASRTYPQGHKGGGPADQKSAGRRRVTPRRLRRRLFLTRNGLVRPMCHILSLGAVLARFGDVFKGDIAVKQMPPIQFLVG